MTTRTVDPAQELAVFLRGRRERLHPRDVGLPLRRQTRRTPGLRREEVAELAGISIDYLVRLEQARPLRPSADVVEALAGALRLAPDERTYLYDLTRQHPRTTAKPPTTAAPPLTRLVTDLSPLPAMVLNHRYDILAWNPEMARLLIDFDTLPPEQRNAMWLCLIHPETREYYVDRERVVREATAYLRSARAAHPDDQVLNELIAQCLTQNEQFSGLWAEGDVKINGRGHKVIRHPDAGDIAVRFEVLVPLQNPDQRLMICRAADGDSQTALEWLHAR
ncbi:helix-turn-helix transcriptional regulator [Streptomyces sp. NBC_01497]|uniref:helix-turn-helix transcriptional regulator n=1 Tax=Streptomyces sp. NBC_01497 TaxID=2903885 RepID=UPI002E350EE2|nr:helix-turn-helix transcriptional regulator [Streptomyces sp. NBC_01497]